MNTFAVRRDIAAQQRDFLAALIVGLGLACPAFAQNTPGDAAKDAVQDVKEAGREVKEEVILGGTFSIQIENDKVANTDRHYTNGIRIGWVSDDVADVPDFVRDGFKLLYPFPDLARMRAGFSLGHTIYTPNDTRTTTLIRGDRPYAGWLFVGASLHGESPTNIPVQGNPATVLDTIELTLGIVGPHAFGEQVQNNYHELIGVDPAYGWDNQLKNEPTLNLMLERRWRPEPLRFIGLEADAIPSIGASLGNVFIYGGGGMILRLGQRLDIDYGPAHIQPSLSGPEMMASHEGLSWYLFAGTEGRAVARNLFLDGNTFRDSPSVDSKPLVADFQVGVAIAYGQARLSLAHVWRTKEFDGQDQHDQFGALNLSWHF